MTLGTGDYAPQPQKQSLSETIEQFDSLRHGFFDTVERYTRLPTATNVERITESVREMSEAFMQAMGVIIKDPDVATDKKGLMIATMLKENDRMHVSNFTRFVPRMSEILSEDPNDCVELSQEIAHHIEEGDNDDVLTHIKHHFQYNLAVDLDNLVDVVDSGRNARLMRYGKTIGKHVLDITKISASIELGLWVSHFVK